MSTTTSPVRRRPLVAVVLATALLAGFAACSADDGESASSADAPMARGGDGMALREDLGGGGSEPGPEGGDTAGQGDQEEGTDGVASRPGLQTRAVIRTGEVALVAKAMNEARARIDDLLGRHGGYLASEDTVNDRAGRPERSVLVMRVPEPAFEDVMRSLTGIGRTERADRSSEDVTTQVIDVDTRVRTQEASIARLQRFMSRATNIEDMIRLESEIATRQASLESLKAQQAYLGDQTSMSTITVRLRTPASPPQKPEPDENGFLAGLSDGWSALMAVLVVAATVTGAVLPFALASALLAVPLWFLTRSLARRRRRPGLPPVAPDAT